MALVHDSVTKCLVDVLPTVSGLQAIYVTTQDGVELSTALWRTGIAVTKHT